MYICVYTHICHNVHTHTYIMHPYMCDYICKPCQNGAAVVHLESVINHYNHLKKGLWMVYMCRPTVLQRNTHSRKNFNLLSCNVAAPSCGHFASLQVTSNNGLNCLFSKTLNSLWFVFWVLKTCCLQSVWSRLQANAPSWCSYLWRHYIFLLWVLHVHFWEICLKEFILLEETKWCPAKAPIHREGILQLTVSEDLTCKTSRWHFPTMLLGLLHNTWHFVPCKCLHVIHSCSMDVFKDGCTKLRLLRLISITPDTISYWQETSPVHFRKACVLKQHLLLNLWKT